MAHPMHSYCVYILASKPNGTLYIGVTNDLQRRMSEHKQGLIEGFTKKYNVHNLMHFEMFSDINAAIAREKQLKGGSRQQKVDLINAGNPKWADLYPSLFQ